MINFSVGHGLFAQISDVDADLVYLHSWYLNTTKPTSRRLQYVIAKIGNKKVYLHKIIAKRMGLKGPQIDHKDRNPFNNQ